MIRRFVNGIFLVVVVVALIALAGCERPKSTGQQLPTLEPQAAGTPTAQPGIPPAVVTTVVGQATAEPGQTPVPAEPTQPPAPPPTQPPQPAPTAVPPTAVPGAPTTHVVKPGEWLWSIARRYDVSARAIAEANYLADPGNLQPGQTLIIPAPASGQPSAPPPPDTGQVTHTVQKGETLYSIARKYGKSVQAIATANGIANVSLIYPGQVLIIP